MSEDRVAKIDLNKRKLSVKEIVVCLAVLLLFAIFSATVVTGYMTSAERQQGTLNELQSKRTTVLQLTASAAAASTAVTLLPGDVGTPIAEKFADMSGYFVFILCALYVEEYLYTIMGVVLFRLIIPLFFAFIFCGLIFDTKKFSKMAGRIVLMCIILYVAVPLSMWGSSRIDAKYQESIQQTIATTEENSENVQEQAQEAGEDEGILSQIFSTLKGGVSGAISKFEQNLSSMIDAVAVLIVTSCVIPLVILLILVLCAKLLLGVNLNMDPGYFAKMGRKLR